jgi:hypothetical protein
MKRGQREDLPPAVGLDGEPGEAPESVDSASVPVFDPTQVLRAAEEAARSGLSPCELLSEAVRAETRLPPTEEPLSSLIEKNDPSHMVDVFESPTFRKRLRELRVWARTVGTGPATYANLDDVIPPGPRQLEADIDALANARRELKAVGRALALVGPNPPLRRKRRFEEMVLLQNEDGSALLDDEGLPVIVPQTDALRRGPGQWQPMDAIERNLKSKTALMCRAVRQTTGLRKRSEIRVALDRKGSPIAPGFRDTIADLLAKQRQLFPRMRAESIALCWAYRVELDQSTAGRLRVRHKDRRKKSRGRGGHSSTRNVP